MVAEGSCNFEKGLKSGRLVVLAVDAAQVDLRTRLANQGTVDDSGHFQVRGGLRHDTDSETGGHQGYALGGVPYRLDDLRLKAVLPAKLIDMVDEIGPGIAGKEYKRVLCNVSPWNCALLGKLMLAVNRQIQSLHHDHLGDYIGRWRKQAVEAEAQSTLPERNDLFALRQAV